ncbi:predicted protein, partial [Nematostella vectensis]
VTINSKEIEQVDSFKFLGIYIDSKLNWQSHINIVCQKIAKNIGIIRYISRYLPQKALMTLYYSLVYPYLTYGNILW